MATLILRMAPKFVEVPEKDIQEVIGAVMNWFESNKRRKKCGVAIFGHDYYSVRKSSIEMDVREAAKTATEYEKI